MSAEFRVEGQRELRRALEQLPLAVQRKALRPAVRAGSSVINKAAKAKAPRDKGDLRRSIGVKVKSYRSGVVVGVIGPRKGHKVHLKTETRRRSGLLGLLGATEEHDSFKVPAKYAHFVEHGTSHSAAKPFLRPAIEIAGPRAQRVMADRLRITIPREAAKYAAKRAARKARR